MDLRLFPEDLLAKAKKIHLHDLTFEHFKKKVQKVIVVAGEATFYQNKYYQTPNDPLTVFTKILPPDQKP